MDPNATLKKIHDFITAGKTGDEVDEWCWDLWDWIAKEGFEPDWKAYPMGTSYYDTRCCYMRKETTNARRERQGK